MAIGSSTDSQPLITVSRCDEPRGPRAAARYGGGCHSRLSLGAPCPAVEPSRSGFGCGRGQKGGCLSWVTFHPEAVFPDDSSPPSPAAPELYRGSTYECGRVTSVTPTGPVQKNIPFSDRVSRQRPEWSSPTFGNHCNQVLYLRSLLPR